MTEKALSLWTRFVETGEVSSGDVDPLIIRSWMRSRQYNVGHLRAGEGEVLTAVRLREKIENNIHLVEAATPVMEGLFRVLRGLGFMVVLADCEGFILKSLVDDGFRRQAREVMLTEGVSWSERAKGTNAIGTSLAEGRPVNVVACQHYIKDNHNLACSAVPIFGPDNTLLGTLDATGDGRKGNKRILEMVSMAARNIERELYLKQLQSNFNFYKAKYNGIIDLIREGAVIVDESGIVREASPLAGKVLGINPEECIGENLEDIFSLSHLWVMDASSPDAKELTIIPKNGSKLVHARAKRLYDTDGNAAGFVALLSLANGGVKGAGAKTVNSLSVGEGVRFTFDQIIGRSKNMQNVVSICRRAARSNSTVMLTGETGTGKEMLAQAIHFESPRSSGPFVAVNCGAIPQDLVESELFGYEDGAFTGAAKGGSPGKFELADGGTVFLDEIGDMPLRAQVSLLRVLQEKQLCRVGGHELKHVDVRVIAATHRNLREMVQKGLFRQDLYFRLNVVTVNIPPLRSRKEDIESLIRHFLEKYRILIAAPDLEIAPEAVQKLMNYNWPGNVRELENVIEGLVNMVEGPLIKVEHLPDNIKTFNGQMALSQGRRTLREMEKEAIIKAIAENNGCLAAAADELGIGRSTLYRKIKEFGLAVEEITAKK